MRTTYRILALVIAGLVILQAASHAWSSAGATKYVAEGGTVDLSLLTETGGPLPFFEIWGFVIHSLSGMYVIPSTAVILLVVGYFSHFHGAFGYALGVVTLVALQVTLGLSAPALPLLAFLHGVNAFLIFSTALLAARHVRVQGQSPVADEESPRIRRGRIRAGRIRAADPGEPVVGSGL